MKKQLKAKKKIKSGIELDTVLFKNMVSKARKGASNNSIIPLTSMMAIELQSNKLTLITTDSRNYLYIIQDNIPGDDFYAVVIVDTFASLVSKTTSETIHLELKDNYLEFTGNGKYQIELPDDEGEMVQFPDPRQDVELDVLDDIHLTTINSILNTVKSSLSVTMEEPCYTGYYCGDKRIIATDGYKICGMKVKLWDEPKLIGADTMELLSVMDAENIAVEAGEDIVIFSSPDCVVYGRTMDCIEDFEVTEITKALNTKYNSCCKIKKSSILQLLDRLSLFVTQADKNEVNLTFTDKGIQVSSKASSGIELIKYLSSENFEPFTCTIDIEMLSTEIKSLMDDAVELYYGDDSSIKFVEGNITKVLALSGGEEDDEEDEDEEE